VAAGQPSARAGMRAGVIAYRGRRRRGRDRRRGRTLRPRPADDRALPRVRRRGL